MQAAADESRLTTVVGQHEGTIPRVVKLTSGPIGSGTRRSVTVASRGRPREMEVEVTGYVRPLRLASSTTMAAAVIRGALTFEPRPTGTLMRWTWDLQPNGAYRLLAPVFALVGRRQEAAIWEGLKRVLEDGSATKGGIPGPAFEAA
jgi:Polyketide cyclase / dehydrase and lipid transport